MAYRLFLGDCLDRISRVRAGSVDLILADLPYGTTACHWDTVIPLEPLWAAYRRVLKPRGAVVLTATQPFTTALVHSNPRWFRHEWVWHKGAPTGFLNANRMPLRDHETILVFGPRGVTYNPQKAAGGRAGAVHRRAPHACETIGDKEVLKRGWVHVSDGTRFPTTVLRISNATNGRGKVHPTEKPVELGRYLVRTYSNPGETVLDNTMGSGSFGVAAVLEGRAFIGIEQLPEYHAIARRRLRQAAAEARRAVPLRFVAAACEPAERSAA